MTTAEEVFGIEVEPRFGVSLYENKTDNTPRERLFVQAELFEKLASFKPRKEKDGPLWSPAMYGPVKRRNDENVRALSCLVLDFDAGDRWEEFIPEWSDYAFCVHTTFQHTAESPRWRAVFPLLAPIAAEDWPLVHAAAVVALARGAVDPACKDRSRMYYLPSHPKGAGEFALVHAGELLDPTVFPPIGIDVREDRLEPERAALNGQGRPGDDYDERATWLETLEPYGWTWVRRHGDYDYWTRPGKSPRQGISARTGNGKAGDRFYCWSSSAGAPCRKLLSKFGLLAHLEHGGDYAACASALARKGYGSRDKETRRDTRRQEEDISALPRIVANDRQLRDITDDALLALAAANEPPSVFVRDGILVRLEQDEDRSHTIAALSPSSLRGILARCADWWHEGAKTCKQVSPPTDVVEDVLSLGYPPDGVPALAGISACPILDDSGKVFSGPGYDPASKWYVQPCEVEPFEGDGPAAIKWLAEEVLCDFPFSDAASRAHALTLMLLPIVRAAIHGATPMHLADAPTPGTGKGLLIKTCLAAGLGREASATPVPEKEPDLAKQLFAFLVQGKQVIFLDNIDRTLKSSALSAALTTGEITDRILGVTQVVTVDVKAIFCATSNNAQLSVDMARRSIWSRIDAQCEDPEKRHGFRHTNLIEWVLENRAKVLGALIAVVRHWVLAGKPAGTECKGSYEAWSRVMGGILGSCGVRGFLDNDADLKAASTLDDGEWIEFYREWWTLHGSDVVTAKQLRELADTTELLNSVCGEGNEKSRQVKLGRAIARRIGKVLEGRSIQRSTISRGLSRFKLSSVVDVVDLSLATREKNIENDEIDAASCVRTQGGGGTSTTSTTQVQMKDSGLQRSTTELLNAPDTLVLEVNLDELDS